MHASGGGGVQSIIEIGGSNVVGRSEVEPIQPPVQEEVQNPELEGVRAWPQEPPATSRSG